MVTDTIFYPLHHRLEAVVVATLPVEAVAGGAAVELIVVTAGKGLKAILHLCLRRRFQPPIALQAARERANQAGQVEAHHHLSNLLLHPTGTDKHAMGHRLAHEKTAVPRNQDAPLTHRDLRQSWVIQIVLIATVKTEEAQAAGKLAQVHIENEARGS
jgi:hypothetical protein